MTINPKGEVVHLRTKKPVEPRLLDGKTVKVADDDDPRKALADWMTAPDNPYFARAMANWVWAQLFGKGLVDPPDDMSRANPPVHPELLDALARHFVEHKYDLRDLIRTVATSEAYGLSSAHGRRATRRTPGCSRITCPARSRPTRWPTRWPRRPTCPISSRTTAGAARASAPRHPDLRPGDAQPDPRRLRPMLADRRLRRQPRAGPEPPPVPPPDRRRRHRGQGLQPERLPGQRPEARARARGAGREPLLSNRLPAPDRRGALAMVGRAEAGLVAVRGGRRPVLGAAEFAGVCVQSLSS